MNDSHRKIGGSNPPLSSHFINEIDTIVIHHSGKTDTIEKIRHLHVNVNGWDDIGYHFIIDASGTIHSVRSENVQGAHVYGLNQNSLGICLLGDFDTTHPTEKQRQALHTLLKQLKEKYQITKIKGHRDFSNVTKTCPGKNFDMKEFL